MRCAIRRVCVSGRSPSIVFWFVPAGHLPTIPEAVERAEHLLAHGDSDVAFGWERATSVREPS